MNLIKIKVTEEDRETLSDIFSYAISSMVQHELEADSSEDMVYYLKKEDNFKDLRQRIVFEELEE